MTSSLSRYDCFLRLGQGGMAEVWLACRKGPAGFRKLLVIKRLDRQLARDPMFVSMFLDEARLAAELSHPNIVQTVEVSDSGDDYFIVMEYLEGQTLRAIRQRGPIPLAIELSICRDVLRALEYAHDLRGLSGNQLGIVHRDVSPDNILITYDGVTKLMDFGVAKAATARTKTRAGLLTGKLGYMAPEQLKEGEVDRRADLFSVAAVLREALCGRPLWGDASDLKILRELSAGRVPACPPEVQEAFPELATLCEQAMESDPQARFETASAFHNALEQQMREQKLAADPREIGEFLMRRFSEERRRMRLAVEDELQKLRSSQTQETPIVPTPPVSLKKVPPRSTGGSATAVPENYVLQRRVIGYDVPLFEAIERRTQRLLWVEFHDGVRLEDVQSRLRAIAEVEHPLMSRLIDCGTTRGRSATYVVRDRPSGRTLADSLTRGLQLATVDAVDLVGELAIAMRVAHGRGLAHGRIGRSSVFVQTTPGRLNLKLIGLPVFADGPSPAGDVKALVRLLFRLIVGPDRGPETQAWLREIQRRAPRLASVLAAALTPEGAARWPTAAAFHRALGDIEREALLELGVVERNRPAVTHTVLGRPMTAARHLAPGKPPIWVMSGDPVFRRGEVVAAMREIGRLGDIVVVDEAKSSQIMAEARQGTLVAPSVVLFGDLNVLVQNQLLCLLRDNPEVSKLLVSSHAQQELLQSTANEIGLDQHVAMPFSHDELVGAVRSALKRSFAVRHAADGLRSAYARARAQWADRSLSLSRQRPARDRGGAEVVMLRRAAVPGGA